MLVKLVFLSLILGLMVPQNFVNADKTSPPTIHLDKESYSLYSRVSISIFEPEADKDPLTAEKIYIDVETKKAQLKDYTLTEIGSRSGNFSGHITLTGPDGFTEGRGPFDGKMKADRGDHLLVSYVTRSGEPITASASIDYHIGTLFFSRDSYDAETGYRDITMILVDEDLNRNPEERDSPGYIDVPEALLLLSGQEGNRLYTVNHPTYMGELGVNSGVFVGHVYVGECGRCVGLNEKGDTIPVFYRDVTLPEPYNLTQPEQNKGVPIFAIVPYRGTSISPVFDPAYLFVDDWHGDRDFIVKTQSAIRNMKFLKYDYKIEFINSATKADTIEIQIPRKMLKEIDLVRINYTKAHFTFKKIDANYFNIELKYPAGINYIEILDTDQINPIDLLKPELVSQSTPLRELSEGDEIIVQSELRNHGKQNHTLAYLVQIEDEDGVTVFIDSVQGFIKPGESIEAAIKWIPELAGNYKIETFVWSNLENPFPLASSQTIDVTVAEGQQESFKLLSKWGGDEEKVPVHEDGRFEYPQSVAVDTQGSVYVAYSNPLHQGIQKFASDGTFVKKWDGGVWHLTSDRSENIFAVESNGNVKKFDAEGKLLEEWQLKERSHAYFDVNAFAVGADNSFYVVDLVTAMILKFNREGNFVTSWGGPCSIEGHINKAYSEDPCKDPDDSGPLEVGDGQFNGIFDIAVDTEGFVYVTDMQNSRIQKFTSDGKFVLKWGSSCVLFNEFLNAREDPNCKDPDGSGPLKEGDGQFYHPIGIAVDKLGYVYVADLNNQNVQKFTKNGEFVTSWGSYCNLATGEGCIDPDESGPLQWSDGQFASPYDIAIDSNDFVYVLETSNGRVQKFTSDGKFVAKLGKTRTFDGLLSFPEAIAVDEQGNVYVAGGNFNRIQKFSSNGTFVMKWGVGGSKPGKLFSPSGIALSNDGYVYVADTQNNRVQKFTADGKFVSTWGSLCVLENNFQGCIDPDGLGALQLGDGQFKNPLSVTTDNDGNLYVFDGNSRIQKFDSEGRFITKWGSFCTLFGYSVQTYSPIPPPAIPAGQGCVDPDSRGPLELGDGQFMWRAYMAADSSGHVYVSDPENKRTQKFTMNGKLLAKYDYYGPIATDQDDNVYVVDTNATYVRKFDDSGNMLARFSLEKLEGPRGIAVDNGGNVYILDRNLSIVQKYSQITE